LVKGRHSRPRTLEGLARSSRAIPHTPSFRLHRVPQGAFRRAVKWPAKQTPTTVAWAPKEEDAGGQSRPRAGTDRGFPPKFSRKS